MSVSMCADLLLLRWPVPSVLLLLLMSGELLLTSAVVVEVAVVVDDVAMVIVEAAVVVVDVSVVVVEAATLVTHGNVRYISFVLSVSAKLISERQVRDAQCVLHVYFCELVNFTVKCDILLRFVMLSKRNMNATSFVRR